MSFTPLTKEQFSALIAQGQDPEQIIASEKQRKVQEETPQKSLMNAGNFAGVLSSGVMQGLPMASNIARMGATATMPGVAMTGGAPSIFNPLQQAEQTARTQLTQPYQGSQYGTQFAIPKQVPLIGGERYTTGQALQAAGQAIPQVALMKGLGAGMGPTARAMGRLGQGMTAMGLTSGVSQPKVEDMPGAVVKGAASYIPMAIGGGVGGRIAGRAGQAVGMGVGSAATGEPGHRLEPLMFGLLMGASSDPAKEMKRKGEVVTNLNEKAGPGVLAKTMEAFAKIPTAHTQVMVKYPEGFDPAWMSKLNDIRNDARKQYIDPLRDAGVAAPVNLDSVATGLKTRRIIEPDGNVDTAGMKPAQAKKIKGWIEQIQSNPASKAKVLYEKALGQGTWDKLSDTFKQDYITKMGLDKQAGLNFKQVHDLERDMASELSRHYQDIREGRTPKGDAFTGKVSVLKHMVSDALDKQYPQSARASALNRIYEDVNNARKSFEGLRGSFFNTIALRVLLASAIKGPAAGLGAYAVSVPATWKAGIKGAEGIRQAVQGKPTAGAMFGRLLEGKTPLSKPPYQAPPGPDAQGQLDFFRPGPTQPPVSRGPSPVPVPTESSSTGTSSQTEQSAPPTPAGHLAGQVSQAITNAKSPADVKAILEAAKENTIVPHIGKVIGTGLLATSLALGGGKAQAQSQPQTGIASTYGWGEKLNKHTASGQVFDPNAMTAASYKWPLGTKVRVTDTKTGNSVVVTINDRGPNKRLGRLIDLSKGAWKKLGVGRKGLTNVKVEPL